MELRETWPSAGIAPRDKEVHDSNMNLTGFDYKEPDPSRSTETDVEWNGTDQITMEDVEWS